MIYWSDQSLNLSLQENHKVTPESSLRLIVSHENHQDLGNIKQKFIEEPRLTDPVDLIAQHQPKVIEQQLYQKDNGVVLIISTRIKKPTISSDYVLYLQEFGYDFGATDNPQVFPQAEIVVILTYGIML